MSFLPRREKAAARLHVVCPNRSLVLVGLARLVDGVLAKVMDWAGQQAMSVCILGTAAAFRALKADFGADVP